MKKFLPGLLLTALLASISTILAGLIPKNLISASVIALLLGMLLNPILSKHTLFQGGIHQASKQVLRLGIILMGLTLSFEQVISVGSYSLLVMVFTLITAFGSGYLLGRLFHMNWKLSSLISAGTGICGGSAIAAIAPTIGAENKDIAYAIAATFLFDVLMVILFPIAGRFFGMSDLGYGLWTGTAVNDTSSVVAAGYAFSDAAGAFSVIVKLTRTLTIVPAVLIFSFINARVISKETGKKAATPKVRIKKVFPGFILIFLCMVAIKSIGIVPEFITKNISGIAKFLMVMALGAIGLKTNYKEMFSSGAKPMLHGLIISTLVVVVSFAVQLFLGQV